MNRRVPWWLVFVCVAGCVAPAGSVSNHPGAGPTHDPVDAFMVQYHMLPPLQKLGRGFGNLLGGWMEVPLSIGKRRTETDIAGGLFTSAAIGGFKGLVRTLTGVYEVVTFVLPFPPGYAPILPTLEYYQRTPSRGRLLLE